MSAKETGASVADAEQIVKTGVAIISSPAQVITWHPYAELLVRVTELVRGRLLVEVERIDMSMGHKQGQEPEPEEILETRNWIT